MGQQGFSGTNVMHRVHARFLSRPRAPTAFITAPEPRSIGYVARGRQLLAGNFLFAGILAEAPEASIWDIASDRSVAREVHGFVWLDDLAAVGDDKARAKAQTWVAEWIKRYGNGAGPGWTPDLVGRRLIRLIHHGIFLLGRGDKDAADQFFKSLARQTVFLSRRWKTVPTGLARFEALAGMIYAGLSLEGMEPHVESACAALATDCARQIDVSGGIATRNPEELLEVFTLLTWVKMSLDETGHKVPVAMTEALARMAPTLRALRHVDGGLARFHGGGRGVEGRLDHALAVAGIKDMPDHGFHMGFARMSTGRSSVIVDAATPPIGAASLNGHAGTLAFELTSGRRPVIVNCGSGKSFGAEWRRAGRATPSHTTLGIDGYSSSRLGADTPQDELLHDTPSDVRCINTKRKLEMSHDGYQGSHGLTHARTLELSADGRNLIGEDLLTTLNPRDERGFQNALDLTSLKGVPFVIRFHLHPDVHPHVDMGGTAVSLSLKSGEVWVFRHDRKTELTLVPSVYLEKGRLKPRETQQVVLSGRAMDYATRVRWSLAKAQETPDVTRDFVLDYDELDD